MPTFLSEITQQLSATKAAPERNRRRRTYPKRHANTKKPSLGPRQVANRAHRPSWAHPNQSHPADAAQPALYTLTLLVPKLEKKGGGGTNCVFRRQNPTLLMASAMACSSAARRASRLTVPPSATRSLSTAASVTSSFVCDESMSEMSVAKRLFCIHHRKSEPKKMRKNDIWRARGSISFHLAVSQPIVSTGAGNRERISLIESYVSRQRSGAGCGFSRACLIALGFCGEVDLVRLVLAFFPLSAAFKLVAETGKSPSTTFATLTTSSTLTRFERRDDADGPGSESAGSPSGSSLNKVTEGFAGLC